jgi:drug/metabolite transporter (DMT)-like permease
MPRLDANLFNPSLPISEQYRDIMPAIEDGAGIRRTTPFFNIYGLLTLVGGALWSAWLFLRKRVLPNRVIGNVLIAAGALSIGLASTLTRFGVGELLYLGELLAAVLMCAGFIVASAPVAESESMQVAESGSPLAADA